ncbi:hypothetical protein ACIQU5_28020 [Streptomyces sp. NPDC090306]|uniref:hypothetical protein n=1 Tax=Streptomyces sp. NPDC090306 TaxID=3365961 RepID=UPI0037FBE31D
MTAEFARPFRLHLRGGKTAHGTEFPSGHVALLDDDEFGLLTGAQSLHTLLLGYTGAVVEHPDSAWVVQVNQGGAWRAVTPAASREHAAGVLADRRMRHPDRAFLLVRRTTLHEIEDV